jgi:DNA-directed RNA polymerase specialized sigma24 family protein
MRALPLELREALLLVSLARFSHAEAAAALDIPLNRLIERLERGRCRLAVHMGVDIDACGAGWTGAAHLRVIK